MAQIAMRKEAGVIRGLILPWIVNHLWDKNGGGAKPLAPEQELKEAIK